MKIKLYTSFILAVAVGLFFATGVLYTGSYVFNLVKSKSYALYETASDLGGKDFYGIIEESVEVKDSVINNLNRDKGNYYLFDKSKSFPKITSQSYLVVDLDSGELIKQKNRDVVYPIASLTKLMTALVSIETIDQEKETRVSYNAVNTYGKQGSLYSGQKINIGDLLYPLLLESSNDAAEVISEAESAKFFMANMNGKAKSIGLVNTYFDDPSGLSQYNVSSAEELFKMIQYIYENEPNIFEISKLKNFDNQDYKWFSNSRFRNDSNYYGGKNGYTDEALHTLISIFDLPLVELDTATNNNSAIDLNRRIAIILLKGDETEDDTRSIVLWLLNNVYYQ